jgi:CheY-like chemotaxis protein
MKLNEARILLVDDEPILLSIFGAWLGVLGDGKLRTASNGQEAHAAIVAQPVDVLITDVRMPIMDGISLVRRLAEEQLTIPTIIFVSGFGDVDHKEMYSLGVEAFLAKPVRREELIDVLGKALAERGTLWTLPMPTVPRQSIQIEVGENDFRLGQGGFCIRYPKPLSLGKVAFRCSFTSPRRDITGEGYVRWYSKAEKSAGIEITFLDEESRVWFSNSIAAAKPLSFIPDFPR